MSANGGYKLKMGPEAAQERADRQVAGRMRVGFIRQLARLALKRIGDKIKDPPTDLPDGGAVQAAYNDLGTLVRAEDWEAAQKRAFELGLAALGWAARMELFDMRESGAFDPERRCGECNEPIPYLGVGRPHKLCDDHRPKDPK